MRILNFFLEKHEKTYFFEKKTSKYAFLGYSFIAIWNLEKISRGIKKNLRDLTAEIKSCIFYRKNGL